MATRMQRRNERGFTLIEVMVSLGVMMVGGMAMIALQTQTIRANSHARQVTTATQIAQTWIERLKEDASGWTQIATVAGTPSDAVVLNSTRYLFAIVGSRGAYVSPPAAGPQVSRGFDYLGNDTNPTADPPPYYCAAYRLNWVYYGEAMRADVRVWWPRAGSAAVMQTDFPDCGLNADQSSLDPGGSDIDEYHVVYLSTVIRVTPLPR